MLEYNVVFECDDGIRTWRSYSSREEFENQQAQTTQKVVAKGISSQKCVSLCRDISPSFILAHKKDRAVEPFGHLALQVELMNIIFIQCH